MIGLPEQLHNPDYRFVLLSWPDGTEMSKSPIEENWQTTNNYKFDDPKLLKHLETGGNVGILCGRGDLRVLDMDISKDDRGEDFALKNANAVFEKLPSFAVRSAHGGLHIYFICHELPEWMRNRAYIKLPHNAGELRLENCYVVCPPSRIDPLHTYMIFHSTEITVSKGVI